MHSRPGWQPGCGMRDHNPSRTSWWATIGANRAGGAAAAEIMATLQIV
jgi:hypothetical protein